MLIATFYWTGCCSITWTCEVSLIYSFPLLKCFTNVYPMSIANSLAWNDAHDLSKPGFPYQSMCIKAHRDQWWWSVLWLDSPFEVSFITKNNFHSFFLLLLLFYLTSFLSAVLCVTECKSSPTGFLEQGSELTEPKWHPHSVDFSPEELPGMWWNTRYSSCVCSWQICSEWHKAFVSPWTKICEERFKVEQTGELLGISIWTS